jgi:hypothetical protein
MEKFYFLVTTKYDPDPYPDPHWFGSLDPNSDTHRGRKLDPDLH